jgi:predicted transposase YbfD/YdcC
MDAPQYIDLLAALNAVRDPRCRRGQRYPWPLLLTLLAAAMLSGASDVRAIGQWVAEHADDLIILLAPPRGRLPSPATLRRALRLVDVAALEACLAGAAGAPQRATPPASLAEQGLALDGKAVRGANRHGAAVHLVSLVRHADGVVLGQVAVAAKTNEITAAPVLLADRDLTGTVLTMDALLTQRALATQIRQQGGHYLMIVKANHPDLYAPIALLFTQPPTPMADDQAALATTWNKGHGRLEWRRLERSAALRDYLTWPDAAQVMRRTCRRTIVATGEVSETTTYAITSLPPSAASAARLEALWRGHWTIENKVHYVRDVTLGEDACQVRAGNAPRALAALRNGLLSLLRRLGWTLIPDALRHYGAHPRRALALLAAQPPRL